MPTPQRKADLLMIFITLIWSGTFIIIKNALDDVPPFLYTALRFGAATLIGIGLWWKHLPGISMREFIQGSVLAFFFGLGFLSQTWGLGHTTVSNSSFITGSMVIFTPIAGWLIEKRKLSRWQAAGVFIVMAGLWLFTGGAGAGFTAFNKGDLATLFCAAMWGLYITFTDKFMRDAQDIARVSARLTVVQFGMTGIISVAATLWAEGGGIGFIPLIRQAFDSVDFLIAFAYTAVLASVVATYIQTRYQHQTSPVKAALMFSTEPVAATVMAVAAGMETMNGMRIFSAVIILAGILAAQLGDLYSAKSE
jgi:drug/metabolite transporter (DMT)-like permease